MHLNARYFDFFAKYIATHLGITFSKDNDFQLIRRLEDVCDQAKLSSLDDLHQAFVDGPSDQLRKLLLDVATNNETQFFRDPQVFKALENGVLVELFRESKARGENLRIWSMACSFGQEPYTLAMICETICRQPEFRGCDFEIFASDVSHRALAKAKSGIYTRMETARGLPAEMESRYFRPHPSEGLEVMESLRQKIRFQSLNILTEGFYSLGKFDVILCRNVLIYQNVENKQKILEKIRNCMKPSGVLVLGAGETLNGVADDFQASSTSGTLTYTLG